MYRFLNANSMGSSNSNSNLSQNQQQGSRGERGLSMTMAMDNSNSNDSTLTTGTGEDLSFTARGVGFIRPQQQQLPTITRQVSPGPTSAAAEYIDDYPDFGRFLSTRPPTPPASTMPRLNAIGIGRPTRFRSTTTTATTTAGSTVHPYRWISSEEGRTVDEDEDAERRRRIDEAFEGENIDYALEQDRKKDCIEYHQGRCTLGSNCRFRHCEEALNSLLVCQNWINGTCMWTDCPLRHSTHMEILTQFIPQGSRNQSMSDDADDDGWSMEANFNVNLNGLLESTNSLLAPSTATTTAYYNTSALTSFHRFQHRNHRVWAFPPNEPSPSQASLVGQSDSFRQREDNDDNSSSSSRGLARGVTATITFTNTNNAAGLTRTRNPNDTANAANDNQDNSNNRNVDIRNTIDCYYYYSSGGNCRRGDSCNYRHCAAALGSRVCLQWIRFNCRDTECNMRHSKTAPGANTNQNVSGTRPAISSPSRRRGGNTIIINNRKAVDDCEMFLYNYCAYGSRCYFRHSKYVKDNYKSGTLTVCPNWESNRSCLSCAMLHHVPIVKYQTVYTSPQDNKEKKTGDSSFECKICYRDLQEIKETGDRLFAINCGHLLCEQCCKAIYLSDTPNCPYCRSEIFEPIPLFL